MKANEVKSSYLIMAKKMILQQPTTQSEHTKRNYLLHLSLCAKINLSLSVLKTFPYNKKVSFIISMGSIPLVCSEDLWDRSHRCVQGTYGTHLISEVSFRSLP